jgi:sugar lactone lactonase YvrE
VTEQPSTPTGRDRIARRAPGRVEVLPAPDVLIVAEAQVGEGPVVDARTGRLCWVDLVQGVIYEHELEDRRQVTAAAVDTMVGAIAPRVGGDGFAAAVADGFGYYASGRLTISDRVLPEPHRRMNDAKCDSAGRLWAGSTHMEFVPGGGVLHRWDGSSPSVTVAEGFTLPNGLGWNLDDTRMYLVDSMTNHLLSAVYDADEGLIGEFTPLCRIEPGLPDGLAVDVDGCVWVAVWSGAELRRFDQAGNLTGIVPMPVTQPSSCAFGPDGTLFITSAREGLSPQELAAQPHAGSVFALATNTRGVAVRAFSH